MGSRSRRKGAKGELAAVGLLSEFWPSAYRTASAQRATGSTVADVEASAERIPYWAEVKVGASPAPWAALRQALGETDGRPVLVLMRRDGPSTKAAADRGRWVAMVEWETLAALLRGQR